MLIASFGQATQRGPFNIKFLFKGATLKTAPTRKEDLHEREDRMDSAQTEKLK